MTFQSISLGARVGGIAGGFFGPEGVPVGAVIGGTAVAAGLGAAWLYNHMTNAQSQAQSSSTADTTTTKCDKCKKGCKALECGIPGPGYRGGSHRCMSKQPKPKDSTSHHMPADSISPLARPDGPAIQMDRNDHYDTPSFGRGINAPYSQSQAGTIGSAGMMAAFDIDAAAVKAKFPNKYDYAIGQARAYLYCLIATGQAK